MSTSQTQNRIERLNLLKEDLLAPGSIQAKLKRITDSLVDIFDADFARIWVSKPADRCNSGCFHAGVLEGPHVCVQRDRCLHLISSSGRYTHIDGEIHRRVPFGCYKIGQIAAAEEPKFVTNNVTEDPRVHNREWAAKLGLTSFAGYRLLSSTKEPIGVLALFSKHKCSSDDDALLQTVASTTSQVIQTCMAEEALRESEQRYRTLTDDVLDTSAVGLFILDASFRVVWVNQAMERYFGIRREQVIGKDTRQLIHAYIKRLMEDPDDFVQKVFATYDNNTYVETFECHVLPDGDREDRWLEHWSQPIHSGLYRGGRIEQYYDITARRRSEDERSAIETQMLHGQKLESLGVLAGGIAHDFNNLLVGILGNASIALPLLTAGSPEHQAIAEIELAAERAADLTKQMLAYSGKGTFVVEPIDLSQLADEMAHLLDAVISKKAVLKYDFPEGLPHIDADGTQIRQVVMNLITNASEAIGDRDGVITIRTGTKEVDRAYLARTALNEGLSEGTYVFFEVTDTGCGIEEEVRKRLFDPFFTTKFTGLGLGLAAVLGIVRGHRGIIKIDSQPGHGSTFRVLLPSSGQVPGPSLMERSEIDKKSRITGVILVVDDEDVVRTTVQRGLEASGFEVLNAADGYQAVQVFQDHKDNIDAVLLDMTMPRLSGEEAFRRIRDLRGDVPILLSSGYSEKDSMSRVGDAGPAGFLQKPYRIPLLVEKLREILEIPRI